MKPSITVNVDPTNPGQFFACCGLLEIAHRITGQAKGWFGDGIFHIDSELTLERIIELIHQTPLELLDDKDERASPLLLQLPAPLILDWWKLPSSDAKGLKLWAGTMSGPRIALAMKASMQLPIDAPGNLLNDFRVVFEPENAKKKVEPFYFDARRGPNAHSRDVGFSPNDLSLETAANPAVEFLALVGLQRARPPMSKPRIYSYCTWDQPIMTTLVPAAITGLMHTHNRYVFESWFRTGQRKHKAFLTAQIQSTK